MLLGATLAGAATSSVSASINIESVTASSRSVASASIGFIGCVVMRACIGAVVSRVCVTEMGAFGISSSENTGIGVVRSGRSITSVGMAGGALPTAWEGASDIRCLILIFMRYARFLGLLSTTAAITGGLAMAASCGGEEQPANTRDAAIEAIAETSASDVLADVATPDPCAPPSDPTKSALCLDVAPEAITFVPGDPAQDGVGILFARLFSSPRPDVDGGANAAAIGEAITIPAQPDGGLEAGVNTMSLANPIAPVRFDGLPSRVYARVLFIDDFTQFRALGAGWWLGGLDLANGLTDAPLLPIDLEAGRGKTVRVDLRALRRLTVNVTRAPAVSPAGNGQGPVRLFAVEGNRLTAGVKVFGTAMNPCGDISGASAAVVNGWVIGPGPYYLAGWLDDFDRGGSGIPGGSLTSLSFVGGTPELPAANRVLYAPTAYSISHAVEMNFVIPNDAGLGPDADTISCP